MNYFASDPRTVVTFVGYSDLGYEDERAMLDRAKEVLDDYDPEQTIVNVGATPSGIGAVYPLAADLGFTTTGIVSSQAREEGVEPSQNVEHVFYVQDETWGGILPGSDELSPTSAAIVEHSDVVVGIGGGEVARDELLAARAAGKKVVFFPAEMNHANAVARAQRKGQPTPTDFAGAAALALAELGDAPGR